MGLLVKERVSWSAPSSSSLCLVLAIRLSREGRRPTHAGDSGDMRHPRDEHPPFITVARWPHIRTSADDMLERKKEAVHFVMIIATTRLAPAAGLKLRRKALQRHGAAAWDVFQC